MDMQLTDRRALVTGSTSGIGYAIARALAAEGAQVTLTGRTRAGVDEASTLPDPMVQVGGRPNVAKTNLYRAGVNRFASAFG